MAHRLTSNGPLLGGDGKERTGHHAVRPLAILLVLAVVAVLVAFFFLVRRWL